MILRYYRPSLQYFLMPLLFVVYIIPGPATTQQTRDRGTNRAADQISIEAVQTLYSRGEYKAALAVLDSLLELNPENADAHAWRGNVLGTMADQAEDMALMAQFGISAMQAFETAIQLDPDNIAGRLGRGLSNLMAPPPFGNIDRAIEDLLKVQKLAPDLVDGHFYLGLAYLKKSETARAKLCFQKTLLIDPGHKDAQAELEKLSGRTDAAERAVLPDHPNPFAFTNVAIIDVMGGPLQLDMSVLISGNRINAIGKTHDLQIPDDIERVNAAGKFLIPGLWDMHVHIIGEPEMYFNLYLANGITGVREMHGYIPPKQWRTIKSQIRSGRLNGPRIVAAGPIVDGPTPFWPGAIAVSNPAQGREVIADLHSRGADFIKVYSFLPRDAFFAIADEAKHRGIDFVGHVPLLVSAFEASTAGQRSLEHMGEWLYAAASARSDEIFELMKTGDIQSLTSCDAYKTMLDDYTESNAAALFSHLAGNDTWVVPTLSVLNGLARRGDSSSTHDERLKYIPAFVRQFFGWQEGQASLGGKKPDPASARRYLEKSLEIAAQMHRADVPLLAGTDSPYVYCFPGFSLHDELALLTEAGLTPLEALQTATSNPALFFEQLDSLGTIEPGKLADLVLLDQNPLEDIRNTRRIVAVVANGRLYTKSTLNRMLDEVEKRVASENDIKTRN